MILASAPEEWGMCRKAVGKAVQVPRSSFSTERRTAVAARHAQSSFTKKVDLMEDSGPRLIDKGSHKVERLARRNVLSSHDAAPHYKSALQPKTPQESRLLLIQRGSHPNAKVSAPDELTAAHINEAANARCAVFCGYFRNLFSGNSPENSSIQQRLDEGHPGLQVHVDRIKREWAFDQSCAPTPAHPQS
jgi:hypothetical protein